MKSLKLSPGNFFQILYSNAKYQTNTYMETTTFLEELEKRLNDLEKEINKTSNKKNGHFHMENMMHFFDSAMDRTIDRKMAGSDSEVNDT